MTRVFRPKPTNQPRPAPAPERAPAYAGHQEHSCPVCANVHGGPPPAPAEWDAVDIHTGGAFRDDEDRRPCDHVSPDYGPCTVIGHHKRAAGVVHVYASRPIVIGDDESARAAATEDTE